MSQEVQDNKNFFNKKDLLKALYISIPFVFLDILASVQALVPRLPNFLVISFQFYLMFFFKIFTYPFMIFYYFGIVGYLVLAIIVWTIRYSIIYFIIRLIKKFSKQS